MRGVDILRCFLRAAALSLICFAGISDAAELNAQKSDTFVFETIPDGEFSKSDFFAVAHVKGERAYAYLPFVFDATETGLVKGVNSATLGKLSLRIKAIPTLPDTNANASKKEKPTDAENAQVSEADLNSISDKAADAATYAADKAEAQTESIIRIEVFGVCDTECFEPNSQNFRISWDGMHDSPAPKFIAGELDTNGLMKLGEIEINTETEDIEDGYAVEFTSLELENYINFAYGLEEAKNVETPLKSVKHAAIILRQTAGPSWVVFYAADSTGMKADKAQSGEESRKEKDDISADTLREYADEADLSDERKDFRPKISFEIVNLGAKKSEQ